MNTIKNYRILTILIILITLIALIIIKTIYFLKLKTKIYHIGLYRCGTTSLASMFSEAGMYSLHEHKTHELLNFISSYKKYNMFSLPLNIFLKLRENNNGNIIEFDSDGSLFLIYDDLYKLNPTAKYIFTFRTIYSWINSLYNYNLKLYNKNINNHILLEFYIKEFISNWNNLFIKYNYKPIQILNYNKHNFKFYLDLLFIENIEYMVSVVCNFLSEFLTFSKDKKNIIIIAVKNLKKKKTIKKLENFTKIKNLKCKHLNQTDKVYNMLDKKQIQEFIQKYKTRELIEFYEKILHSNI